MLDALQNRTELDPGMVAPSFLAVEIDTRAKAQLRSILQKTFDKSPRTLFPDVAGLAEWLSKDSAPLAPAEPDRIAED